MERLAKINTDLRRKNVTQRKQARSLLQEKVDLQVLIQEKDQQVSHIKDLLKDQESMEPDHSLESPVSQWLAGVTYQESAEGTRDHGARPSTGVASKHGPRPVKIHQ